MEDTSLYNDLESDIYEFNTSRSDFNVYFNLIRISLHQLKYFAVESAFSSKITCIFFLSTFPCLSIAVPTASN